MAGADPFLALERVRRDLERAFGDEASGASGGPPPAYHASATACWRQQAG